MLCFSLILKETVYIVLLHSLVELKASFVHKQSHRKHMLLLCSDVILCLTFIIGY
jgi:hypothetical protein